MPNRFPTEAANADFLGEDPDPAKAQPEEGTRSAGTGATPRGRAEGSTPRQDSERREDARPGKDINQAGFIKDKDA